LRTHACSFLESRLYIRQLLQKLRHSPPRAHASMRRIFRKCAVIVAQAACVCEAIEAVSLFQAVRWCTPHLFELAHARAGLYSRSWAPTQCVCLQRESFASSHAATWLGMPRVCSADGVEPVDGDIIAKVIPIDPQPVGMMVPPGVHVCIQPPLHRMRCLQQCQSPGALSTVFECWQGICLQSRTVRNGRIEAFHLVVDRIRRCLVAVKASCEVEPVSAQAARTDLMLSTKLVSGEQAVLQAFLASTVRRRWPPAVRVVALQRCITCVLHDKVDLKVNNCSHIRVRHHLACQPGDCVSAVGS